jgi:biotin carboxyl carrier protein
VLHLHRLDDQQLLAGLAVEAPMQGTIVSVDVHPGDAVQPGHA